MTKLPLLQTSLFPTNSKENSGALFSADRFHRFMLWRIWNDQLPLIMFIGLNPSTANETEPDPTIRKVVKFAENWCYGGFYMMNLFTYVTPHPEQLVKDCDEKNNLLLLNQIGNKCTDVVFAWGDFKEAKERCEPVMKLFPNALALIINKNGTPRHPLYVPSAVIPVKFKTAQ